ncbi:hypothetical protein GGR51DRAFT_11958 [Nemania sp. FL0031]|nr:hypothetical protein GGR51DRAFT_11958 [Nemania sp. FL0031]
MGSASVTTHPRMTATCSFVSLEYSSVLSMVLVFHSSTARSRSLAAVLAFSITASTSIFVLFFFASFFALFSASPFSSPCSPTFFCSFALSLDSASFFLPHLGISRRPVSLVTGCYHKRNLFFLWWGLGVGGCIGIRGSLTLTRRLFLGEGL